MFKKRVRALAFTLALTIFTALCPVQGLSLFAFAESSGVKSAQTDQESIGAVLDYSSLLQEAYIVNPQWTNLTSNTSLSFEFRGNTYNETYNPQRHFSSFSAAYSYFESLYTESDGSINSQMAKEVPVFILAPGTYTETRLTVRYNAVILGANAGISPNADIDLSTANPKTGWNKNTLRGSETVISNGFSRSTQVNSSLTNQKYEQAASNETEFSLIIDGVKFSAASNFLTLADTTGAKKRTMSVTVQNNDIVTTNASFYIDDSQSANNVNCYDFKNIRSDGTKVKSFFGANASHVRLDGVYFANSSGSISQSQLIAPYEFSFLMQNSYMYKCSAGYNLNFRYKDSEHKSKVTLNGNLFYEHNSGSYGALTFYSTKSHKDSSYEINIQNNIFIADQSYNTTAKNTFLNGNTSYQQGAYAMYVNRNRVIGYTSLFPNMPDNVTYITADFNYNYFAPSYNSHADVLGTTSQYFSTTPYSDPIDIDNLVYYEDFAMTVYDGMLDVSGVSFYEDADYVSIDNDNSLITASYTCGTNIQNPALYFRDSAVTAEFFSDSSCASRITSISAPAQNAVTTVYAKAVKGSASKVITVKLYGENAVDDFASGWSDPEGTIQNTAYLLSPETADMSNGAVFRQSFDGRTYSFTVGQNAFATLEEIFAAAGSGIPQIILPYGSYGELNITAPCQIYGENYKSAAAAGSGTDEWGAGLAWSSGKTSKVSGITLSCANVTISGVELCGAVSDLTRTQNGSITFKNSLINAQGDAQNGYRQFNVGCPSVQSLHNEYILDGVYIKNIPSDESQNKILFGGALPSKLSITNSYSNGALTRLFDAHWNSSLYSGDCEILISDSRFNVSSASGAFLTDSRDGVTVGANTIAYTVKNSVFESIGNQIGALISLSPQAYTSLTIEDNTFIHKTESPVLFEINYKNTEYTGSGFSFKNNRIVGFSSYFAAANYDSTNTFIDVSENYFAPYSEDFIIADDGICPTGFALCSAYYEDYALTKIKNPVEVLFSEKDGLIFDSINSVLELFVESDRQKIDFTDGYVDNLSDLIISGVYLLDGETADMSDISVNNLITTVKVTISVPDNPYVYTTFTLKIHRNVPALLSIHDIIADRGVIAFNEYTGGYTLTLPETSSGADIFVKTADGTSSQLMYNGQSVTRADGIESGTEKNYIIRVTDGTQSIDYTLRVVRPASAGLTPDYDSYPNTAYIIDADWANTSSGNISFTFRGEQYTQPFDSNRHFANFDSAYAHWLGTDPDILHDTPVFIFTEGSYGAIKVYYRAMILGTNAGINPNDPSADVSELLPGGSIAENTAWDSEHETVFTDRIYRSTRVSGNDDLSLEKNVQDAENAADERMEFFILIDGIKLTGSGKLGVDDVDVGSRTDSDNSISLNVTGKRSDNMYLQNIKSVSQTGHLYTAQDTTFNYNSLTVKNLRMTGFNGSALIRKYLDTLVFDGAYIENSSMSVSIFDVDANMNMRHDMDYTVKNSCFTGGALTRAVRIRTTPLTSGDYQSGKLSIYNNAFLNCASAQWGIISVSAQLPDINVTIEDNLFSQQGGYEVDTAIEGNSAFFTNPMTMNVHRNRFIGITSYLPNMNQVTDENLAKLSFDFSGNYLSDTFTSVSDKTGKAPEYVSGPDGNTDPIGAVTLPYYCDFSLNTLSTDFDVTNALFGGGKTMLQILPEEQKLKVMLTENITGALEFITKGSGVDKALYPAGGSTPVTSISYKDVMAGNTEYTLKLSKNGAQRTYSVTLEANEIGYFKESFSDPLGQIQSTAYLLSPDIALYSQREIIIRSWKGRYYRFTVGENAFSDIDEINAVRSNGHIQIIIPDTKIDGELIIPADTSVYGINYDVNPNTPVSDDISSDWTLSDDWGTYGQSEIDSISISPDASGTNIEIKGITLRGRFYDTLRGASSKQTKITLENIVIEHEETLAASPYGYYSTVYTLTFSNLNNEQGGNNTDIGVMKNVRVEKVMCSTEIYEGRNRLLNEYLPSDFTIDGLYCDLEKSQVSLLGWWKMSSKQRDGRLSVKNCNLRNGIDTSAGNYLYFEGRNHANNGQSQTAQLNITGNCFYNFQTKAAGFTVSPYAYSDISIQNNLFLSSTEKTASFIAFNDTAQPNEMLKMNISGNRFVGVAGVINNPSNNSVLDLSGNYYNVYSDSFITGAGRKILGGSNTVNNWQYQNYALTIRSDGLTSYKFSDKIKVNSSDKTLKLTLGAGKSTFSLNDYIIQSGGNSITVSGVSDITEIPAVNDAVYTVSISNNTSSEQWVLEIDINSADMSALYTALERAAGFESASGYREYALERIRLAAKDGEYIIHSDKADKTQADNAAQKINLAADIAQKLLELDSLTESASEIDTTSCSQHQITELNAAINSAVKTAERTQSTLTEINAAYNALQDAIDKITLEAENYGQILKNAEIIKNSEEFEYYTEVSAENFLEKYETAKTFYGENNLSTYSLKSAVTLRAENITEAMQELVEAMDNLTPDTERMLSAIADAQKIKNSDHRYTAASYKVLTDKIDEVKAIISPNARQIMQACTELESAVNGLIDQSEFNTVLKRTKQISNDSNLYCTPTFDALLTAISNAEAAAELFESAADVSAAVNMLTNAENALKKHSFGEYVSNNDADCENNGTETAHCTTYGCTYTDTRIKENSALGHNWDNGTVTKTPTCSQEGELLFTCRNDSSHTRTETIPIDADEHAWDNGVITKEPTCSAQGEKLFTCKNDSSHTKVEAIPVNPDAHKWSEFIYNNDATEEADGTETRKCEYCGKEETRIAQGTKLDPTPEPEPNPDPDKELTDSSKQFSDVENGRWYKSYIDYVATYKLMNGTDETVFAPAMTLTRAMFVQILANMSGVDTENREVETAFSDVPSGKWYTPAVKWAFENGIVDGTDSDKFSPNDNVQRQQICTMIVRYAKFAGIVLDERVEKKAFNDESRIQNYAKEAVEICQRAGIIDGMDEHNFAPRDYATRAQVATIITRFHQSFVKQ